MTRFALGSAMALVCSFVAANAAAQRAHTRRRFEPTDLGISSPGTLDMSTQVGVTSGETAHGVLPDLEIALGLVPGLHLELDGSFALPLHDGDHAEVLDNAWLAAKLSLFRAGSWAGALQLGPKLPLAPGARGAGYEALAIAGTQLDRLHLVFNAGALLDPGTDSARWGARPAGLEVGLDVDLDLDAKDRFSLLGEISGVLFAPPVPGQLQITAGIGWSVASWLGLSLVGLVGPFGGDRLGILLGVAPRIVLWR